MKTAAPKKPVAQPMARWEIIVALLLAAGGTVGWNSAKNDLSVRRDAGSAASVQRTKDLERARTEHDRLSTIAAETGADTKYQAPAQDEAPAPASRSGRAGSVTVSPAAKSDAVSHIADLVGKGVLQSAPTAAANGNGRTPPAFAIGADGKLSPGFGTLFNLSPDQVAHLQEVVTSLKEQAENVVLSRTSVRQISENSYSLDLLSSADDAALLRNQFVSEFQGVLGETGYRQFSQLNGERTTDNGTTTGGPAATLTAMLGESRSLTITRNPNNFQFTIGNGEGRGGGGGTAPNLEVITNRFPGIMKLLPPTFTTPFTNPVRAGGAGGGGGGDARGEVLTPTSAPAIKLER